MLQATAYDVVILDIMGVRGFDLLDTAVDQPPMIGPPVS